MRFSKNETKHALKLCSS